VCCYSGYESEDITNDELPDQPSQGFVDRHSSQHAVVAGMDSMAGDVSEDLYSEISSRDTEQLLKSRVSSKTRRAAFASKSTSHHRLRFV